MKDLRSSMMSLAFLTNAFTILNELNEELENLRKSRIRTESILLLLWAVQA
jgi:hypothetical protein